MDAKKDSLLYYLTANVGWIANSILFVSGLKRRWLLQLSSKLSESLQELSYLLLYAGRL